MGVNHAVPTFFRVTEWAPIFLFTSEHVASGTIYMLALLIMTILKINQPSLKLKSYSLSSLSNTGFCLFQNTLPWMVCLMPSS